MTSSIRAVCEHYGWSSTAFDDIRSQFGWEPYVFHISQTESSSLEVGALHIYRWAFFGNSIIQLCNAISICREYGIKRICYSQDHDLLDLLAGAASTGIEFLKVEAEALQNSSFTIISSTFFHVSPFNLKQERMSQIIEQNIRPMLPGGSIKGGDGDDDNEVFVAHFRSGDIFSTLIHPGYGQPPLSYYLIALDEAKPSAVVVVSYDLTNPTTALFVNECVKRGISVRLQCSDLETDLRVLLNARTLVSSMGTFCWIIAILSQSLKTYWFFERLPAESGLTHRSEISFRRVIDKDETYSNKILRNNWSMSTEQLQLMLNYPIEQLVVEAT